MLNFEITIASIPTREELVAEIFYKNERWVEISREAGESIIRFYACFNHDYTEFSCEEAIQALQDAKSKLMG